MRRQSVWVWSLVGFSVVLCAFWVFLIYTVLLIMSALASLDAHWIFYVAGGMGFLSSVAALVASVRHPSLRTKWSGGIVSGLTLVPYLVVVGVLVTIAVRMTNERYIIPSGYQGNVDILFGMENGSPIERSGRLLTYRVPSDGILRTQARLNNNWTHTEYYYQLPDGRLTRITGDWPSTIDRTPENLSNTKDYGIFFPRSGSFSPAGGCSVHFEEFYVGTKAYLLSHKVDKHLDAYQAAHPSKCSN